MEDNAARVVQNDLYRAEFWKHAGSESIADRMAVAATLGESNPAAQSAWMHGADVIRSTYGIDLQKINREHPNSQEERHAALRDALDDRFQMNRYDAEADRVRDAAEELGRPTTERENVTAGPGNVRGAETEAEAQQWIAANEARIRRQVQPQVESAAQGLTLAANYRLSRIPAIVINRKTVVYGITDVQQALELARRQPGGKP